MFSRSPADVFFQCDKNSHDNCGARGRSIADALYYPLWRVHKVLHDLRNLWRPLFYKPHTLLSTSTIVAICALVTLIDNGRGFHLLTHSMVQSPSWAANWFAASQEIPRISRNPNVHYRTHKLPPPVSILDQPNPVHIPTSHLLEIHPNIIHPSMHRSPQWSLSLRFPHQEPIYPPFYVHYVSAFVDFWFSLRQERKILMILKDEFCSPCFYFACVWSADNLTFRSLECQIDWHVFVLSDVVLSFT